MIKVTRTAKPNVLVQNSLNWTEQYLLAKEVYTQSNTLANKKAIGKAEKRYNHTDVKSALKKMFNKKCAFCESRITHVDYGQIEHFKPKSKYPELCFEWNNFLLSCSICNGKANKGDKFPLENEDGPFIHPVDENPQDFFKFEYDDLTQTFLLFPANQRAETTIKILGLNREDLVENRTIELKKILFFLEDLIGENFDEQKFNAFEKMFSEKDQYFAFISALIQKIRSNI
ncbi:TIGR02646 family protein [Flavobacterium azooxidireducens]|uniref:TIGR02646 family protein n=1 Tax=Flavobacterium azooxidireducens TaxID=1871076 RepID=A0ABY4KMQ2_9FLAO|nr:retron system putative HNH endonuclease [Flavobacterium azooxidireducens]UPQ80512.1 TIGR02646 family protein [Flavobacterium azooxidireducens]